MIAITLKGPQDLCQTIAALFSPPDTDAIREFRETEALTFLEESFAFLGGDSSFFDRTRHSQDLRTFLANWPDEYGRLFAGPNGDSVSLVESFYKSWTLDPECSLSFAREKGLLRGDSALHVSALYQSCGMEVTEEFKACPDHLSVELEFLSLLYEQATDREIKAFISDHLDWVPLLRQELMRLTPHPAYDLAIAILDLFLRIEKERLMIP